MAKELPYFRFTAFEWLNDDISLESYELKGLFIDICAYYWFKDCSVTLAMLEKRFNNAKELIQELIILEILKLDAHDYIIISFLDKQYDILSEKRKKRQNAGRAGGLKKSSNAKAKLKQSSSYKDKYKDKENNKEKDEIKEIKEFFNSVCKNLPKIHKISDQRLKLIKSRAEEYDFKTIGNVFHIVAESDFLNGNNKNNWTASFDWILNKTNFLKILEGNYNNKENGQKQSNSKVSDEALAKILYKHLGDQKEK